MTYQEDLQDIQITVEKTSKKIRNLRMTVASGPDKIGPAILQGLEKEVALVLTIIFCKSLDMETFRGTG
jgi:hypothetical protein